MKDKKKVNKDKRRTEIQEKAAEEMKRKEKRNDPPLYTPEEITALQQCLEVEERLNRKPDNIETIKRQLREAGEYV